MAMTVPNGDPFAVPQQVGPTQEFGLVDMPETQFSRAKMSLSLEESAKKFNVLAEQWQKEQDETRSKDLINQIQEHVNDLQNNPETGFRTLKGSNATMRPGNISLNDEVGQKYDTFVSGLLKEGVNKNVRDTVKQFADATRGQLMNAINVHLIDQGRVYRDSVNQKSIEMASAMALSDDPQQAEEGLYVLRSMIKKQAQEKGIEPDYTKHVGGVQFMRIQMAVNDGNLGEASRILKANKDDMSALDQVRAQRLIQIEARKARKAAAESVVVDAYNAIFSPENQAADAVRMTTGAASTSVDYETAYELADHDDEKAVQILAYGVDRWQRDVEEAEASGQEVDEYAMLAADRNASMALDRYRSQQYAEPTLSNVDQRLKDLVPDMDATTREAVRKKIVKARKDHLDYMQDDRNEKATILYAQLRNTDEKEAIDKAPVELVRGMKRSTYVALATYSKKKDLGALTTNSATYWDLISDDDRLKKMSDEELIQHVGELTDQDFDDIWNYRQGLITGKFTDLKGTQLRNMVKDSMARNGLEKPSDEVGKAAYGYALRSFCDRLKQEQVMRDAPLNEADVDRKISELLHTEFTVNGVLWGTNTKTVDRAIRNGSFNVSAATQRILDAGLESRGILDPDKTNRAELMISILVTPTKPILGAEAMADEIAKVNPGFVNGLVEAYAKKHGGFAPDASYVVRAYLQHSNLLSTGK